MVNDFENQSNIFYNQVENISIEYDWKNTTKKAMDSLINRVGIDMFDSYKGYLV
jgi:hypothetical protein